MQAQTIKQIIGANGNSIELKFYNFWDNTQQNVYRIDLDGSFMSSW